MGWKFIETADNYITDSDLATLRAKPVQTGSTLFAKIGEAIRHNHRVIASRPLLIDNNAIAATPTSQIDPTYLYRFLQGIDLYPYASSTTVPSLRKTVLERIPLQLPPIVEQRRIAAILDHADALRATKRHVLRLQNDLANSAFRSMFGKEGTARAGGRQSTIGDSLRFKSGNFLPSAKQVPGPYAVYGGNGVTGYHNEFMFEEPKVVVGRVGAYCGVTHLTSPRSWVTDNALWVSEVSDDIQLAYLVAALRSADLNQYASQSGQPLISSQRLADVPLFIPSKEAQSAFDRQTSAINAQTRRAQLSLSQLDELFTSLQARAFRAEL
ncbi:hypothetical protein A5731_20980 [Mycolicibacterium conceptionense]|uniref:Type I restriction modification DNA specificity domain-containing protein n=2 Tax=Mycolicibacterium conceptionense TaxID=451644 RepID=A0A1A1XYK3_9MYCO|nr:hypothetical protein A5718_27335 [Mycolicibacterium conceptionense]OBE99537.1 hypothetical protein A5731_20980 [Mycolicibacterium conceptionense]OBF24160.1 hypothetical protein A5726_09980 [Mycolicibacterium conceptionense]OBF41736.1 hypothetical protein A5720_15385 [Mycolicibacterium conceptionense]OBH93472.1 hypothetical protein A5716_27740 [Mycolicibacterium conceptionense]